MHRVDKTHSISRISSKAVVRALLAGALSAGLAISLAMMPAGTPAQAADGEGPGGSLQVGVANDHFASSPSKKWSMKPSSAYPGTVRIQSLDGKKCLATQGGKNDGHEHGVQWTGCNNDASKSWVVEPLAIGADSEDLNDQTDSTTWEANGGSATSKPRFVLRSWKYPKHCLFSTGNGFDGGTEKNANNRTRGVTPNCGGAEANTNPEMQFSVMNDNANHTEWSYLQERMVLGAVAFQSRPKSSTFAGKNLWARPLDKEMKFVGNRAEATEDGYFLPEAIVLDPAKQATVYNTNSLSLDCIANDWSMGVSNKGDGTITETVTVEKQRAHEFTVGVGIEGSYEAENKATGSKVGVKVNGQFQYAHSRSTTVSRSIAMTVGPKLWGSSVFTLPSVNAYANWKTGAALGRVWYFNGPLTVAVGTSDGTIVPNGAFVTSRAEKSCKAMPATMLEQESAFRVVIPDNRNAPQVGDVLTAETHFIQQTGSPKNDVRYQWYLDGKPLATATGVAHTVTQAEMGKSIHFTAYEHGGRERYESEDFESPPTPAVVSADLAVAPGETVELATAIFGRDYETKLSDTEAFGALTVEEGVVPGLVFDRATQIFSGVPTRVGSYTFEVTGENEKSFTAQLRVDPEATLFANSDGYSVRAGAPVDLQTVEVSGTDASYSFEYLDAQGNSQPVPEGLGTRADASGAWYVTGTPVAAGTYTLRVTESSPYETSADAPQDFKDFSLQITDEPIFTGEDGEEFMLPLGQESSTQLANMVPGSEPLGISGVLPAGMTFDGATGTLAGTPATAGSTEITIGRGIGGQSRAVNEAESRTFKITVFGAPQIELTRTEVESQDAPIVVGEDVGWHATATPADSTTVVVTAVGSDDPVDWASMAATAGDEIDIDGTPTKPGKYVLTVTAQNAAGESVEKFPFTVVAKDNGGDNDGNGGDTGGSGEADKPATGSGNEAQNGSGLARTGSNLNPILLGSAAAIAIAAGAWGMIRARRRNGHGAN
ncbi:putative Ig domain-containing protein [Leucobacter sp. cx-42]|uniref:putative Ig domain-containing protein n=1 Tax=unclassified Leucobacter TaxID=2621730 RepID=UPI00165D438A|nr:MULTISPECIES: putative Ig domain-containing protein [unclassified Leucobacter]MBC9953767.1 putative Ig domain-containing protein [Leucobacter sp. cx-42]